MGSRWEMSRARTAKRPRPTSATKKVITNEDLPPSPDVNPGPREIEGKVIAAASPSSVAGSKQSAEQWKSQILAQKNAVATLQGQIGKLNASIYFVEANAY